MAPIALAAATAGGYNGIPFLMAVTVAASMCFASPFSTPPNALVMSAGGYKPMDYVKVGLPLQFVMALVMIFVFPCSSHSKGENNIISKPCKFEQSSDFTGLVC